LSVFNLKNSQETRFGDNALIIVPENVAGSKRNSIARMEEALGLARAIQLNVVLVESVSLRQVRPATFLGSGQIEKYKALIEEHKIALAIVDNDLSPVQQSNLEKAWGCKVIDRAALILEIFGARAQTAEGRLQVELAHLDYQAGRLVRSWTHLERQRGGFGFLGGPGETQIEADRRMIRDRMAKIRRELEEVKRTRGLHRERRKKAPWPVVALVGYTNAGKSTLFNRLTGADSLAQDMLFATLDPKLRQVQNIGVNKLMLSDTVGFVSNLPTQLIAAFRATLEEVISADVILHVRDIAHEDTEAQRADVLNILEEIGAQAPICEIWNKSDLLEGEDRERVENNAHRQGDILLVSALADSDTELLKEKIAALLNASNAAYDIELGSDAGEEIAWLYNHGKVMEIVRGDETTNLKVMLSQQNYMRFQQKYGHTSLESSSSA
jgi:GTPase